MKKSVVILTVIIALFMSNLLFGQTHARKHHKVNHKITTHHRTTLHNAAHHHKSAAHKHTTHHTTHHARIARHHKWSKHPAVHRQTKSVDSRDAAAEVEIKNGSVFINDDFVLKIKSLKNEDDKITVNYIAPPPPPVANNTELIESDNMHTNSSEKPVLGIYTHSYFGEGAAVEDMAPCGPADEAGLYPGDVIVKIDDHDVTSAQELIDALGNYKPGDKVSITYIHLWRKTTTEATLTDKEKLDHNDCPHRCLPMCRPCFGPRRGWWW